MVGGGSEPQVAFSTFDEGDSAGCTREWQRIAGGSIFLLLLLPLLLRVLRSGVCIRVVQGESDDGPCTSTAVVGDANNHWELVEI